MCKFGVSWERMGLNGRNPRIRISTQDQCGNKIRSLSEPGVPDSWDRVGRENFPSHFPGLEAVCCDAASVAAEAMHQPERAVNVNKWQCPRARIPGTQAPEPQADRRKTSMSLRPRNKGLAVRGERSKAGPGPKGTLIGRRPIRGEERVRQHQCFAYAAWRKIRKIDNWSRCYRSFQ